MAPSKAVAPESDPVSQADTPMTDAIDDPIPSVPVDGIDTVSDVLSALLSYFPPTRMR